MKKILVPALGLLLAIGMLPLALASLPALATSPTTSVTIIKYAADGSTANQTTVSWVWMRDNLPVQGDGTTHYYHQGPTFDDSTFEKLWDPGETVNVDSRDCGAAMGTDVKDLCNLAGGARPGDTIKIKAADNFAKWFDYEDIYAPEPDQGKVVVTWYTAGTGEGPDGYVPEYASGMRLVFFAQTPSPQGKYVFGNWDMHETLAESRWHYYYDGKFWPSSSGLTVKYVRYIEIYSGGVGERASDSLVATANVTLGAVGIALDRDSLDFGNIKPGETSALKSIGITNTGTVACDVTLEVQGNDSTAQDFYEQSLFIDDLPYSIEDIIAFIGVDDSQSVGAKLKVPSDWTDSGEQKALFIFWATASE